MARSPRQLLRDDFIHVVEQRRVELGVSVTEWVKILGMSRPNYYRLQYHDGEMRLDSFLRMLYYTDTPIELFMNLPDTPPMEFTGDKTVAQLKNLLGDRTFEDANQLRKAIELTWRAHQAIKQGENREP